MTEQELQEREAEKMKKTKNEAQKQEKAEKKFTLDSVKRGVKNTLRVTLKAINLVCVTAFGIGVAYLAVKASAFLLAYFAISVAKGMLIVGATAIVSGYFFNGLSQRSWNPLTQLGIETPELFTKKEVAQKQAA